MFDDRRPLGAYALIARVSEVVGGAGTTDVHMEVVAGSLDVGGMSGGPILDASGRILGVVVSLSTRIDDQGRVVHSLAGCCAAA